MMKEQVLFIDDDSTLLEGLRRLLRPLRHEWDVTFASRGREALALMADRCFDVVVCDMRMPELDGADVLAAVRERCPNTVRIVLSGQAEMETVFRALSSAHQYIAKPCSPEQLKVLIHKACSLRRLLKSAELSAFVSNLSSVPGDIETYDRFRVELSRQKPLVSELARIVSSDISLTVKILQLANSGFFGNRAPVLDAASAIAMLGVDLLSRLVRETAVFDDHPHAKRLQTDIQTFNRHSVSVAALAREIAAIEQDDRSFVDACYTAAILHDIGKIILSAYAPLWYSEAFRRSVIDKIELEKEERHLFGASHSEIGAYLVALWGLPLPIVEAVAYHHEPRRQEPHCFGVTSIVHITNALQDCAESIELKMAIQGALPRYIDEGYVRDVQEGGRLQDWFKRFQSAIPCYETVQ